MSYAERSYSYDPGRGGFGGRGGWRLGQGLSPWVTRLLVANGGIWLLNAVGLLPFGWTVDVLGFAPDRFLVHPWSPLTYMFVHGGFLHVFFNMLVLYFFGPPLERVWGGRAFIKYYLIAGLGGALASVAMVPLIGSPTVIGASAAIYGVMLAFALRWPNAEVLIWFVLPVKVKWLVTFMAGLAVWATFSGHAGHVAQWAHLGGLITGFLYLRFGTVMDRGLTVAGRGWRRLRGRTDADGRRRPGGTEPKGRRPGPSRRRPRRPVTGDNLDEVDRILDKIRESGIESLTNEERDFLDEMSRRYRG